MYSAPTHHDIVLPEIKNNIHFSTLQVNPEDIIKKISTLDSKKGPGPDKIPNKCIKNYNLSLTKPFSILFNRSLKDGRVPSFWKDSTIVPMYKSGIKKKQKTTDQYRS